MASDNLNGPPCIDLEDNSIRLNHNAEFKWAQTEQISIEFYSDFLRANDIYYSSIHVIFMSVLMILIPICLFL